jgi:hypothetical protein
VQYGCVGASVRCVSLRPGKHSGDRRTVRAVGRLTQRGVVNELLRQQERDQQHALPVAPVHRVRPRETHGQYGGHHVGLRRPFRDVLATAEEVQHHCVVRAPLRPQKSWVVECVARHRLRLPIAVAVPASVLAVLAHALHDVRGRLYIRDQRPELARNDGGAAHLQQSDRRRLAGPTRANARGIAAAEDSGSLVPPQRHAGPTPLPSGQHEHLKQLGASWPQTCAHGARWDDAYGVWRVGVGR